MKTCKIITISFLILSSQMMFGQFIDPFLNKYSKYKDLYPAKAKEYKEIEGSPYLNDEFKDGVFYLKDTSSVKVLLRYNLYTDAMEYRLNGINYAVGNPILLKKILLGESVYVYLPFIPKGGFFELIESGKCTLVRKKTIKYKPAEGPKPIVGVNIPAKFIREPDIFYMVIDNSQAFKIKNIKSITDALQNQKLKIEDFIKLEKIKKLNEENLIKIAKYYNSL